MKLNKILRFHFMKGMKLNEIKLKGKTGKESKNKMKLKEILGFNFLSCLFF